MGNRIDLTSNVAVTSALLADPWGWRSRVVEQLDVDSPESVLRRRSLQCAPLRPLIAEAGGIPSTPDEASERAHLVLPVVPIPKGPLLEFDIEGPGGGEAFLIKRADIAAREAAFVAAEAAAVGVPLSDAAFAVVEAAVGFTEAQWVAAKRDLDAYLRLGLESAYDAGTVRVAVEGSRAVAKLLAPFAEVPAPRDSAVENPALVLPVLVAGAGFGTAEAVAAVTAYADWLARIREVESAESEPSATDARTLLTTLVDYGNHFDLMALVDAPLDEPFLVKVSDRRHLRLSLFNAGEQSVVIADAESNHFALRVADPNARLSRVRALSATGKGVAWGTFTSRKSPHVHATYAFEPDRDYRIVLSFRVGTLWRLRLVPYVVSVLLVVFAAAVYGLRPAPGALLPGVSLATFAAGVLLTREPSALGSRLRRVGTAVLACSATALLAATLFDIWVHRGP